MNIIKKIVGIVLSAIILSVGSASQASAGFFDNSSNWSFDSLYQNIQDMNINRSEESNIQSNAVASVISPATNKAKIKKVKRTHTVSLSAYSSSVDETDSTPFITAANTYVRDGIVASNLINPETGRRYAFGTAIKIPDLFGDKIFIIEDRMNSRYVNNVDVWVTSKKAAREIGRRTLVVEIVS
ncbi:MAG: hypothetical protein AAB638_03410 [Patescibacteria group bacterium]